MCQAVSNDWGGQVTRWQDGATRERKEERERKKEKIA